MKKRLSQIFLLILIIVIILFLRKYSSELYRLLEISPIYFILLLILILLSLVCNGLRIKLLTNHYSINLKIKEWFGLSVITTAGNFLAPFKGGAGARAVYLKKKYNFSYTSFLTTLGAMYILSLFLYSLLGIIVLITLSSTLFNKSLLLFFIALFLVTISIILFSPSFQQTENKFINYFIKIINEWRVMRKHYKLIFSILVIDTVHFLLTATRFYLAFQALAYNVPWELCLLITPLILISGLITITPAALGIREGAAAFSSKIIGFGVVSGALASSLDRIVTIVLVFILSPIFSYILIRKFTFYNKQPLTKQI